MSFMVGGGGGSGGGSGFGGGGGDETFLEAFVESVSTLPHEVKRNLELLKDLDARCGEGTERMLRLQNEYLEDAEGKMMELEVVVKERWRHQATDRQPEDHLSPSQEKGESAITEPDDSYFVGIRVLGGTRNSSSDGDRPGEVVIPTTMELEQYVYHQQQQQRGERSSTPQPALYEEILELQRDMQQMADEKVAVARQLYDRLDGTVRRLDHDLAEMERLLQASGDFSSSVGASFSSRSGPPGAAVGKPNDLAACQITLGSGEWILAKVLQHDPSTGMYRVADEDVESNKIYHLPEAQVILCGVDKLSKGDVVFCVYPDTTSFYQATVVQAPRKNQQIMMSGGGGGPGANPNANAGGTTSFVMVNFVDDSDEYGVTHDKAVPLQHVIYPPYGSVLK